MPLGLHAQFPQLSPAVQPEMTWWGDKVVISASRSFVVATPGVKEQVTIQAPPNTIDNRFAQDAFWVLQADEPHEVYRISRSEDGHEWELVASFPFHVNSNGKSETPRFYFHPLKNNNFLLVARAGGWFTIHGKPSAAVIATVNDKQVLQITRDVEFGFQEKLAYSENGKIQFNQHYLWFLSGTINRPFLTVGDKVFLAFRRIGTFIEIRPDGSTGQRFQAIPGLDEKTAMNPNAYDWAVLCAQPTKDDKILVLSRTPEGVLDGQKRYPRDYSEAAMENASIAESIRRAEVLAFTADPFLYWLEMDPSSGRSFEAAPPRNVPVIFNSIETFRKFVFYFHTDGSLAFPLLNQN